VSDSPAHGSSAADRRQRPARMEIGVSRGGVGTLISELRLSIALHTPSDFFAEPGHECPPMIPKLVDRGGFEVSGPHRMAIWHGGYAESAARADGIVAWLNCCRLRGSAKKWRRAESAADLGGPIM